MAKAKKQKAEKAAPASDMTPIVAAELAGVIYQARLLNRQAKLNIPETEIVNDVVSLWRKVRDMLAEG
ncbi:MAG: hypothetical protein ABSG54_07195 [Terriglobia bacterium]|jgi:hypothetical protein